MKRKNLSRLPDQELLKLIRAKDEVAVGYLFCLLDRHMRNYLYHRIGDVRFYANLVASTTVTILIEQDSEPKLTSKLSTYAIEIAHKQWSNMERHIKRNEAKSEEFLDGFESTEDIYEQVESNDRRRFVNCNFQKLNKKCKLLLSKFCMDFKPKEVYAELGYSSKQIYQVKKSECIVRLRAIMIVSSEYHELFGEKMEDC
jgi:DNA-directed RNA polymerase specialized sigma24 family protein